MSVNGVDLASAVTAEPLFPFAPRKIPNLQGKLGSLRQTFERLSCSVLQLPHGSLSLALQRDLTAILPEGS